MLRNLILIISLLISFGCNNQDGLNEDISEISTLKNSSYDFLIENDSLQFFKLNKEYLSLAKKQKDSASIADSYWNYAIYYKKKEVYDSAFKYYRDSYILFAQIGNNLLAAKQLYNQANIQNSLKDYTSAEINTTKSLSLLAESNYNQRILNYNLLGIIHQKLFEYDESIKNFNAALLIINQSQQEETLKKTILNNLGLLYQKEKKYTLSIKCFKEALELIEEDDYESYARYITNLNFTKFLSGDNSVAIENQLLSALDIRTEINSKSGKIDSYLKLAEFYLKTNKNNLALEFAQKALVYSTNLKLFEDVIKAYTLLNELDSENSTIYFTKANQLRDSLDRVDRAIRNKFTRIQYKTDQYIDQTQKLTLTNNYLLIFISLMSIISIMGFYIYRQRSKQKQVRLEQEIELDKIEMYKLSVENHQKFKEGVGEERKRISMELHDGVLSSITSIKLSLGYIIRQLNKSGNNNLIEYDYHKELSKLEEDIRQISHDLHKDIDIHNSFLDVLKNLVVSTENLKVSFIDCEHIYWKEVDDYIKSNIIRIIQEAYKNTLKHSKANHFKVTFKGNNSQIQISIDDDGIGFKTSDKSSGIGLKNISKRVIDFLKGSINIESDSNGTTIKIIINEFNKDH